MQCICAPCTHPASLLCVESDSDGEDSDSDGDSDMDDDPTLEHVNVNHYGGVNRIRSMPQAAGIVATMADTSKVHIFDLTACAHNMMNRGVSVPSSIPTGPVFTFEGHKAEGYGLDWNKVVPGRLATGDTNGAVHVWNIDSGSAVQNLGSTTYTPSRVSCQVEPHAYRSQRQSIEDIQWSPTEGTVFITASSDKSLAVWDVRGKNGPQITLADAHLEDVNVLSWNTRVSYLLASGSDDGSFKVWVCGYQLYVCSTYYLSGHRCGTSGASRVTSPSPTSSSTRARSPPSSGLTTTRVS